jgi:PKD repeat protein
MAGWGGFVNASPETGFWQSSTNGMPVTSDAHQKTTSGSDFYFIVLNGDATELVYSTYLGGSSSKTHVDGGTSRFDKYGIVYHAVCSGCSFGNSAGQATSDFPTTSNAKSRLNRSQNCNNAAFKFDLSSLRAMFDTNNLALSMPGFNNVCYPDSIVFQNLSTGGRTITWDFGDGTVVAQEHTDPRWVVHQYEQTGSYQVTLTITDPSTCSQTDFTTKVIKYFEHNIRVGEDGLICEGSTFQLTATGGSVYTWVTEDNTFVSSDPSPVVRPELTSQYFVTVRDANACVKKDTILVTVLDSVDLKWQHRLNGNCTDYPSVFVQNLTPPEDDVAFHFDFGDGTTSQETEVEHIYEEDGLYSLKFIAQKQFCSFEEAVQLPVYRMLAPNVFTPDVSPGFNDDFEIRFGPDLIGPTDAGLKVRLIVIDRWGKTVFESQDYKNDWNGHGLASGIYYYELKVGDYATCKNWLHIMK